MADGDVDGVGLAALRPPHGDRGLTDSPHQNYAQNNAVKYNFYRFSCGRDRRLDSVWGDNARSGNAWGK